MPHIRINFVDRSREPCSINFYAAGNNQGNAVGNNLVFATLAKRVSATITSPITPALLQPYFATDPFAQREIGLRVVYLDDTTGESYSMTIPAPIPQLYPPAGTDYTDLASNITAIVIASAFETNGTSPVGNPVTVQTMQLVGRAI